MESMRASFDGHEVAWKQFLRAYHLQMAGRLDDALAAYRASIDAFPTAEALTFYGWTLSFMGRIDEAIHACRRAIDTDPDFGNPYNDIGAYLLQLGRPSEAIPWLEKALTAPRYESPAFPHCNLGAAFEALGRVRSAIDHYKRALALAPDRDFARKRLLHLVGQMN
jgi:Tfp pilus assembly protein PilF